MAGKEAKEKAKYEYIRNDFCYMLSSRNCIFVMALYAMG